jgi:hypothetical protein
MGENIVWFFRNIEKEYYTVDVKVILKDKVKKTCSYPIARRNKTCRENV